MLDKTLRLIFLQNSSFCCQLLMIQIIYKNDGNAVKYKQTLLLDQINQNLRKIMENLKCL
ncbi:hypothetical protein pb186bvf_015642 [Paramecium bursaria]